MTHQLWLCLGGASCRAPCNGHNDDDDDGGGKAEEDDGEFVILIPSNGDGANEYNDHNNEAEDGGNDCKPAALPPLGGSIRIGRHNNDNSNNNSNNSDCNDDNNNNDCDDEQGFLGCNDGRLLCSICLKTVSNKPVVTRCGHLYCWLCLCTWLEPKIDNREYSAAFRGSGGNSGTHGRNSHGNYNEDDYDEGNSGSGPGGRGG
jgi:hypothetical protein